MARVSIQRPHLGRTDETEIEITLNLDELSELSRLIRDARSSSIMPVAPWITDLARLAP